MNDPKAERIGRQGAAIGAGDERTFTLWQELRNAIRGTDADYTRISLKRAILLLAVPMVLELIMESTFAVVDIFFVESWVLPRWRPWASPRPTSSCYTPSPWACPWR